ncbi:hypothetical protein MMC29_005305 [Sticta canariensis]|nr:hypothetical protein [Sticta canariensis]
MYPIFESSLQQSDNHLKLLGCQGSLIEELLRDPSKSKVNRPGFSQPLCTAIQKALVDLLASWDILPSAVFGHSSGEIAAAYCVGGISRESAWAVSYFRGIVAPKLAMRSLKHPGSMTSVALSELDLKPYIEQLSLQGTIAVGCVNSPKSTTVIGDEKLVDALKTIMDQRKIFARKLAVDVDYHSAQMNGLADEYQILIKN